MTTSTHCIVHLPGEPPRVLQPDELEKIDELRAVEGAVVWLDLRSPDDAAIRLLREEFGVHPLAEEDLQKRRQRPKLDTYPDQQVAVIYETIPAHESTAAMGLVEDFGLRRTILCDAAGNGAHGAERPDPRALMPLGHRQRRHSPSLARI
jgi:Mg2+ and Co2+ transporter CorA